MLEQGSGGSFDLKAGMLSGHPYLGNETVVFVWAKPKEGAGLVGVYDNPDFRPGMHSLWQIKEGTIGVSATELPSLIKLLEERAEKRGTGYKVAIVVRGNLDFGLSTLFQMNAYELPFEVKVFQSLTQAKQWIIEDKL